MADNIQVDTRVTPALHPQNVHALEAYDEETSACLSPAYDAFETAYSGLITVHQAREAASQDPTLNEAAVAIKTQEVADRVLERVTRAIDGTSATLRRSIDNIEKELTRPIEAQASHQISMEIRMHVSKLSLGERSQFVMRAINGGDHRSATAVLGAPGYLSGLTDEMQAVLTRAYHEKHNKGAAKRVAAMKQAVELLDTRGGLLFKELEKAVGMAPHKVKELRERKLHADRVLKSA